MTLTEQLKNGELKVGEEYWVILTDEWYLRNPVEPVRAFYSCDCEFEGYLDDDIKEVLAPVPSYEEWKQLHKARNDAHEIVESLTQENQQLKELLKECREKLKYCVRETYELQTKIDNAMGEKK